MADVSFWIFLSLLGYTYFGYPLALFVVSIFANRSVDKWAILPEVAVVIPVHNAEGLIQEKLRNCLAYDYPRERLKIIVVSDFSTDGTERVVESFGNSQVELLRLPFRGGKVAAQNFAVRSCDAEIFVFTDVAIRTDPSCVRMATENFHDKAVGVVSCRDAVVGDGKAGEGEKSYIAYDMLVRKYTSKIGSMIGVTGGFYAVRREIAKGGWNPAFPPDFYVALRAIKRGLRVIEDPRIRAYYGTAAEEWDELPRKTRTINRGIRALFANASLLNPIRYGFVSIELISHKLCRWLTPFFLLALLMSSAYASGKSAVALVALAAQIALYLSVVAAFVIKAFMGQSGIFKILQFFGIANVAMLKAWYEFLIGKSYVMWEPTKR